MKCEICGKELKSLKGLLSHINLSHKVNKKQYYDKYLKQEGEGICGVCGNPTNFVTITDGYREYCSCSCSSKASLDKRKQTCLERYGVEHPSQSEDVKNKLIETNRERYGVDNPLQREEVRNKITETNIERYGVDNPLKNKDILEQQKQTCLENYGVESPLQSEEIKNKFRQTCLENYGVEHPFQSEEIKQRKKETCLENYGVESPLQSEEIKEKIKQTWIKNYGVEHPSQSEEIKQKKKETYLEKYGVLHIFQSEEIKEKIKQTNLNKYNVEYISQLESFQEKIRNIYIQKYGVDHPSKTEEFKNKVKQTNLEKYGKDNPLKVDEIKEKVKQTNLERYEVEYPIQNDKIKEKSRQTLIQKYGHDNPLKIEEIKERIKDKCLLKYNTEFVFQNEEIKEKIKQTNLEKYGKDNPLKVDEIKEKIRNKKYKKFLIELHNCLNYLNLELLDNEYIGSHYKHNWKCTECGYEFKQIWNSIQQGYTCPICYPRDNGYSKGEKEVSEFIKDLGFEIIENSKQIIPPKELDIYIPEMNIGIEFDGLYYHSELFNSNSHYHLNKTLECEEKGIQLIHIFEDEWILKQNIVKERLKQILHVNNSIKIHARDCYIQEIDAKTKNEFLDQFHLQGSDISKIKVGAFYKDRLISVMTFSKGNIAKGSKSKDGIWELNRFCSDYNYHIPGIASKLLKYFKRNYKWDKIFSYADRRWSQGNLYKQLNFQLQHNTNPNYWYINGIYRIHRFNLRKRQDEPEHISEYILRLSEGFLRTWDCGNMKFELMEEVLE